MDEWEARYKALCAGIHDDALIARAERVVESAIRIARTTPQSFEEVFYAMMEVIRFEQSKDTFAQMALKTAGEDLSRLLRQQPNRR